MPGAAGIATVAARLEAAAAEHGLMVFGHMAEGGVSRVLLAADSGFWDVLTAAPEYSDGQGDPVDRWSTRIVGELASAFAARAEFPFGGPPYQPFIAWALATGRAWKSPTGMLVHDRAGLMISLRGALLFDRELAWPDPAADVASPCERCPDRPCASACPVAALSADADYDVAACHGYLDSSAGIDCMESGCAARRACPVSRAFARPARQSAHHMGAFHP